MEPKGVSAIGLEQWGVAIMKKKTHHRFRRKKPVFSSFAHKISHWAGHPLVFFAALGLIALWLLMGKYFNYSDAWQLVINTGTTIVTFLMVFLIQHTQNRDAHAFQLKLDELIRATKGAHTVLLDIEEMSEKELLQIQEQYHELAAKAREQLHKGHTDTGSPDVKIH
jgi:low affinity Fe/Cu permease